MFSAEAFISGTVRKVGDFGEFDGNAFITISIPDNRKDQPTIWYELTFWGPDAVFVHKNFRNGTVLTARCSIKLKNNHLRLNVLDFTPLHNWGKPKEQEA